jgi:hypothetical protein
MLLFFACAQVQAAEAIEITHAHIESTEDGYRLVATFAFDLNQELEAALQHGGVPLTFKTEVTLTRPRWYWKDERAVETSQTTRISYDVLTRQYSVKVTSGSQRSIRQTFPTLDDAMVMIHHSNWLIASRGQLKPGETYNVQLRMFMDRETFSKPIQVNALNNSDWRLNSRDKRFIYRAE